jgi:hypothetical protein
MDMRKKRNFRFLTAAGVVFTVALISLGSQGSHQKLTFQAFAVPQGQSQHWMAHPVAKALLKQEGVYWITHAEDYAVENGLPTRQGIETITYKLDTKTIGKASLTLSIFSDPKLQNEYKDAQASAKRETPAVAIAKLRRMLKDLDSEKDPDLVSVRNDAIESVVKAAWDNLEGGSVIAWKGDCLVRTGSQTSVRVANPLMLAFEIATGTGDAGGALSEKLNEFRGQLRRAQKRYDDATEQVVAGKKGATFPIETVREWYSSRAEFAIQYMEEHIAFQRSIAAAISM